MNPALGEQERALRGGVGCILERKGDVGMGLAPVWGRDAAGWVAERRVPAGGWRGEAGSGLPAGREESGPEPRPAGGKGGPEASTHGGSCLLT